MSYFKSIFCLFVIPYLLCSCGNEEEVEKDPIVTAIHLDVTELTMDAGDEYQFTATHEPYSAPAPTYEWSYSPQDSDVTISQTGLFKAIKPGNYIVKVKATDILNPTEENIFTADCDVTVEPISATRIRLSSDSIAIQVGRDTLLSYTVVPEYASVSDIQWTSSDENVAIVKDGRVETINIGKSVITAYSGENPTVKADCILNVLAPSLDSISIVKERTFSGVQVYEQLEVTYYPANAERPELVWSSSNTNVAVVSSEGMITTRGTGSCIITVSTKDGRFSATCEVEVLPVKATDMYFVGDKEIEVSIGKKTYYWSMYLYFEPENVTNRNFTIEQLSGFDVATISSDGERIKGLKEGTATFRATAEDGGYSDVCTVKVIDEVGKNVNFSIQYGSYANIAGYVTAGFRCSVLNLNEDPILVTGLDVLPSGGGNSNSASFSYHGYVEYLKSKYWENSFNGIYEPYFVLHFQYNGKSYTIREK